MILGYALKKTFTVKAMFCERCGKRIEKVDFIGQIGHLIFVVLIFLTIVLATITHSTLGFEKSLYVVGLGILFTIGFKVWFSYYNWKYFPKIKRIDEKTVVLKIKGKGKLRFSRT